MAERHADTNNRINCQISERRQREDGSLPGGIGEGENNKEKTKRKTKRKKNPGDRRLHSDSNARGAAVPRGR